MHYAVGEHFDKFIQEQVALGRFANGDAVVRAGLRMVEERVAKLNTLRDHVEVAIEEGGSYTDEEVGEFLDTHRDE